MSNAEIIRSLKEVMSTKQTPTAYDSSAVVTRIEGNATAWVKIAGSDTETPVKLTIDAKAGDTVQVRVGGGSAWLTGNQTAPPTDNTRADEAMKQAEKASGEATNFVTDTKDGIFVHPKDNDRDGVRITDAIEIIKGGLSFFRAWVENGLAKVRVGKADAGHTNIDSNGMRVYGGDGNKRLSNIGYGEGNDAVGVAVAPYYEFGTRAENADVGNYSMLCGHDNEASGFCSFAEGGRNKAHDGLYGHVAGFNSEADGYFSYAFGEALISRRQFVVGVCNDPGTDEQNYAFIIGNGEPAYTRDDPSGTTFDGLILDEENCSRSNALTVDWSGKIVAAGGYGGLVTTEDVTVSIAYAAGNIGTRGASESLGTTVKAGHAYIGAYILDNRNTAAFNATIQGNGPNNTAHLCAYRATGNAVSNASVTVRKIWLKTGGA